MTGLTRKINRYLNRLTGYEIHRVPTAQNEMIMQWISRLKARTIIDIGANRGDYCAKALELFPGASVHCFEPLPDYAAMIRERFSRNPNVFVYELALGAAAGKQVFHRSKFAPSSSFLRMLEEHVRQFPGTEEFEEFEVKTMTLDEMVWLEEIRHPLLVKMDVQGYEGNVIRGGQRTFRAASAVLSEVMFKSFYSEQTTLAELAVHLGELGFEFGGMVDQSLSADGEPLYGDAIFLAMRARL
jgi:FkbM family methyltransferase